MGVEGHGMEREPRANIQEATGGRVETGEALAKVTCRWGFSSDGK